ncbi:MAG: hypothetical protein IH585_10210 [Anaerolineaceae bacterium]|nr:hypothetical protein [Anaerolineaceae bacterium]
MKAKSVDEPVVENVCGKLRLFQAPPLLIIISNHEDLLAFIEYIVPIQINSRDCQENQQCFRTKDDQIINSEQLTDSIKSVDKNLIVFPLGV